MKNFKVQVTLKSGKTITVYIRDSDFNVTKALNIVDENWGNSDKIGYLKLGRDYFRLSEIVHYKVEPTIWKRF